MITELKFKDHDEWLEIRSHYLGGSDASASIGMSEWKSPYTLWCEKTGKVPHWEGNLTTEIGSFLEEKVAELFARETGKKVQRKNATMVNDLYPWACANIDRKVVGENALLEIKTTTSIPVIKKVNEATEFPENYYAQVLHYMAVGNYEKAYLAVLINCRELKIFELERNQGEIDSLMAMEKTFWEHVENDTPPEVDGTDSTTESLSARYPEDNGETVDISTFDIDLENYYLLDERIKELKEEKDKIANEIKEYMGESARGESEHFKISYTTSSRSTFDNKRFADEHPELDLGIYFKTSTSRTFRPSRKK